jgi:hypothetical protein
MSDPDMERWASAWRDDPQSATADLARMARRERRVLYAWIAMDWIVAAGLFACAAWLWYAVGTPTTRFAAGGIVALTVIALAFSVNNWRGSLSADRASAADFLAQAERRGRARLRYVRFGWWVLLADLIVIAGAVSLEIRDEGPDRMFPMLAMTAIVIGAAAGVLWWWERRERRRAVGLAALRKVLRPDEEKDHG